MLCTWHADSMDNPTNDEVIGANHVIAERDFQNPLYSDIGPGSYEILHSESALSLVSETLYDNIHNCVPGALTNRGEQANGGQGMRRETTSSEAIYDMPSALDNVDDDNCYSHWIQWITSHFSHTPLKAHVNSNSLLMMMSIHACNTNSHQSIYNDISFHEHS